jgi:hypothetical protein
MAADPSKSNINVSLNCLRKRSHSGSGSSCGSSFGPCVRRRAVASEWARPLTREEERRSEVSLGVRRENSEVVDYSF